MATIDVTDPAREVRNQPPPLAPINVFEVDLPLREALEREGGGWAIDRVREAGAVAGSVEAVEHGRRGHRHGTVALDRPADDRGDLAEPERDHAQAARRPASGSRLTR